jgi:hypothetical protein
MVEAVSGNDPQTSYSAQGSNESLRDNLVSRNQVEAAANLFSKNQDEASTSEWAGNGNGLDFTCDSSVLREGISGLDGDWRQGLDEPSKYTKKRRNTDVSSSSALNSASDLSLSEALSQISKDLGLSSPSLCSGEEEEDKENEEADSPESHGENLQAEVI